MLKPFVKNLEEVPEAARPYYVRADNGGYKLDVESTKPPDETLKPPPGDDPETKRKLAEFRDSNIELRQQMEGLQEQLNKFKDIDPERYSKAMAALERMEDDEEKSMIKDGKFDEVFKRRTAAMKEEFDTQLAAVTNQQKKLQSERDLYFGKCGQHEVSNNLSGTLDELKIAVRQGAMPDLLARAHGSFVMTAEGALVPQSPDGKKLYGADGVSELTMKEWTEKLLNTAPHLFEPGKGADSDSSDETSKFSYQGGKKVINAMDPDAFQDNIEKIAKGEITAKLPMGKGM